MKYNPHVANISVWRRQRAICQNCHQWRKDNANFDRGHDPCIRNMPGEVWGCCGHGESGRGYLSGYVAGVGLRTFRFKGTATGNAIRRTLNRISGGFQAPMWVIFDDDHPFRQSDAAQRHERRINRLKVR